MTSEEGVGVGVVVAALFWDGVMEGDGVGVFGIGPSTLATELVVEGETTEIGVKKTMTGVPVDEREGEIAGVTEGVGSQTSPTPLLLESIWLLLETVRQLSQSSPRPSPSVSSWDLLGIEGQLSQSSPIVSASESSWVVLGMEGQLSQAFPYRSPSESS